MSKTSSPQWSRLKLKALLQKISSTLKDPICLLAFIILLCSNSFGKVKEGSGNFPEKAEKPSTAYGINHGTFNLINSLTDQVITAINDGDTFYLDTVGDSLNIQAVPNAITGLAKVKFTDHLGYTRTEGVAPYAYKADTSGDYWNWTPALGSLSFTVEYLDSANAVLATDTFAIVFQQTPPPSGGGYWTQSGSTIHYNDGAVGIGTTSPTETFDVNGNIRANRMIKIDGHGSVASLQIMDNSDTQTLDILFRGDGGNSYLLNGKLGIGTATPDSKLTVKGNIHAEEVKVDLGVPGPDYVFNEDYYLRTLEEVQAYIDKYGHLPNIPSAFDMEKNGILLSIISMKLLEKIEELTLYTIQQEKKISKLEEENRRFEQLEKRISMLEKRHY